MGTFDGRHALITGGGTGIGAAIAAALAAEGARLTIAGRRRAPLEAMAAKLPGACIAIADVTKEGDCAAMVAAANAAHGPVDLVIANAGAAESAPAQRIDLAHWQRMIDVNLTGTFLTVKAALADITRKDGDASRRRIVMVSSTAGIKGYAYVAAYCAAKHGVVGLARALALELASRGITVNAVCPGFTETALIDDAVANIAAKTGRTADAARAELARANPQGRLVTPAEVAATVAWLCGPGASAINGQAISVSGGEA
jgi:NAD(P)-dependent dehydrogenase (short-subunit alcohol dehydrogenase family)